MLSAIWIPNAWRNFMAWTRLFILTGCPNSPGLRHYDYALRALNWARRWKANLVYTRLPQAAAIASQLGIASIYETHDLPQSSSGIWLTKRFLQGSGARRLVTITAALAADLSLRLETQLKPPLCVIAPDAVDLIRFNQLPDPPGARQELRLTAPGLQRIPERFTVGYTGHLYSGRGTALLLDMAQAMTDTTFLLVGGEPSDVSRLQSELDSRSLKNVFLTGFVLNSDLPLYQAACNVLLMPYQEHVAASSGGDISRYLSPMKMFEYMACQRPIISSNLPVLQEILNSENSVLLPPDDLPAWVGALCSLRENETLGARLAGQARQDVENYTWEGRVRRIMQDL